MTRARLIGVAVALGILLGVVVAVAVPQTTAPKAPPLRHARALPAFARYAAGLKVEPASVRTIARTDDPAGGPGWVIRSFSARLTSTPPEGSGPVHLKGRRFCLQLGRIVDGRFGWIDAENTFRPVRFGFLGAPIDCFKTAPRPGRRPGFRGEQLLTGLASGEPRFARSLIWGSAGETAGRARIHIGADTRAVDGRGFVEFGPPDLDEDTVSGDFTWTGGPRRHYPLNQPFPSGIVGPDASKPAAGARAELEVRTPDPSGGVPWGLPVVRSDTRAWCSTGSPGRVVENRVGGIDYSLGTFHDDGLPYLRCPRAGRTWYRHHPLIDLGWSGGGAVRQPADDPETGRVARRTQRGTIYVEGTVRDDVAAVTIASPRDVRTLPVSPRSHSFLAIYDGDFPTGRGVVTLHFRNGTSRRLSETIRWGDL